MKEAIRVVFFLTVLWVLMLLWLYIFNRENIEPGFWSIIVYVYFFCLFWVAWKVFLEYYMPRRPAFKALTKLGFMVEQGTWPLTYTGVYRNYYLRVYCKYLVGSGKQGVHVELFYRFPKADGETLYRIAKKYNNTGVFSWLYNQQIIDVKEHVLTRKRSFNIWNGFSRIQQSMDFLINIAEKENLPPFSKEGAEAYIRVGNVKT
jgi:hypothetical protein